MVGRSVDGTWRCQRAAQTARLGRNGTRVARRPPVRRRHHAGRRVPARIGDAWDGQTFQFFGNSPDPGVRGTYRNVRHEDCWGATPNTARYQHVVNLPQCPGPDDEWLAGVGGAYSNAAVIGANLDPISGDAPGETPFAAAIFLHRHSYAADGSTRGLERVRLAVAGRSGVHAAHDRPSAQPAFRDRPSRLPAHHRLTFRSTRCTLPTGR